MRHPSQSLAAAHTGAALRRPTRRPVLFAAALAAGISSSAAFSPAALAASAARTSVAVHSVSPGIVAGSVGSAKASCLKGRIVELQARKHGKWVTQSATRTNSSGQFTINYRRARTGDYRLSVVAKGSCGAASAVIGAPTTALASTHPTTTPTSNGTPSSNGSTTSPSSGGSQAPACSLPLARDAIDGFQVGVPSGWETLALRGQLVVAPNGPTGNEGVVIIPAAQTSGLTAASYFQSELSAFESELASPVTVTGNGTQGGQPSVTFTVQQGGQTLQATAYVIVRQNSTQVSSSELDFVAYWAPQSTFATESATLTAVLNCYGPQHGSLYQVYQDQAFTYILPPAWTVSNENSDAIDLSDGQGDIVTYQLVGGTPSQFTTPQSLINLILSGAGISSITPVWDAPGQGTDYKEFTGSWKGQPVHGLIFASASQTSPYYSTGYYRALITPAANWNALNGPMIQMAGSIQHDFTQDLQTINQLNQQWQHFDAQVANFDDTLNNQQLVQDPRNGKLYEAPYGAYTDGAQGPGYYLGDQLLNQVERH